MIWAMAALVLILLLLVALGNLRLMLGFLALAIVSIGLLLFFDMFEAQRSASRIPVEQIELQDFKLAAGHRTVYELSGRVKNHSLDYGLFHLVIRLLALDCPELGSAREACTVIADQEERLGVDVPAGQARDVSQRIGIDATPLKPRGMLRWDFEVVATTGG